MVEDESGLKTTSLDLEHNKRLVRIVRTVDLAWSKHMGLLDWLKCKVGSHMWSTWSERELGRCEQQRTCQRCNNIEKRFLHEWSSFGPTDSCQQKRACSRCPAIEEWVEHIWGVWEKESPLTESLVRFCRRCPTGKQIKDPYVIVRVSSLDGGFVRLTQANMGLLAPSNRMANDALANYAKLILTDRDQKEGGGIEIGYRPQTDSRPFSYFAWEWDDDKNNYRVVKWDGTKWS